MKLSQEQISNLKSQPSASTSRFSKLADYKVPDSPPPEKEPEDDDPNGPNKFDQLMKAACSIKTAQLEQQRKKFELLPTFLKAGVYYTQKHEVNRIQTDFSVKMMVFDLLKNDANAEFAQRQFDRACRKYEEALGCFRYYEATDPSWQDKGIDDDKLREVDIVGDTPEEKQVIVEIKISLYLNIAACNIKVKAWSEAIAACEEVLKLDKDNIRAFYRRARATALPINAGVPDLRKAIEDLDVVLKLVKDIPNGKFEFVKKEKSRVQGLIDVNYKRERQTYSKMFNSKKSVNDYVKKTVKAEPIGYKTIEEKEFEKEMEEIDKEVQKLLDVKMEEFSFEIKPNWEQANFQEVEDVDAVVQNTVESYRIFKKGGKFKEADMMKAKIKETKYAKQHLKLVMNLDFTKPTPKMIEMAKTNNIDLQDPNVLKEFKKIQDQNLLDIQYLKQGKRPPSKEEMQEKIINDRDEEFKKKMKEYENKNNGEKKESKSKASQVKDEKKKDTEDKVENEAQPQSLRDQVIIAAVLIGWFAMIFYFNYYKKYEYPKNQPLAGHKLHIDNDLEEL